MTDRQNLLRGKQENKTISLLPDAGSLIFCPASQVEEMSGNMMQSHL